MVASTKEINSKNIVQLKGPPGFNGNRGASGNTNETVTIVHYDVPSFTATIVGFPNPIAFNGGSVNVTNNDTLSLITANSGSFNTGANDSIIVDFYITLSCSGNYSFVVIQSCISETNDLSSSDYKTISSFLVQDGEVAHYYCRLTYSSTANSYGGLLFEVSDDCDVKADVVIINTRSSV